MRESAFACTHTHASGSDTGTEANAVERRLDVAFRNSASEITSFGGVPIRPPVHTRHYRLSSCRNVLHCIATEGGGVIRPFVLPECPFAPLTLPVSRVP
jgi:hypothetical protein